MKKVAVILSLAVMALFFSFPGFAYVVGDVNSDNRVDLAEAINALQVTSGMRTAASETATIEVTAGGPMTIQQAIDLAKSGDVISVAAGTYTESLSVSSKGILIQGAGKETTTIAGISGSNVISIDAAGAVVLSGVTIQGGKNGIWAQRGAVMEVKDAIIKNTANNGIGISENTALRLSNVTVQGCTNHGIFARGNSTIFFFDTVASNSNLVDGISLLNGSIAYFSDAIVTADGNTRHGIQISNSSNLMADGSTIAVRNGMGNSQNLGRGFTVSSGSATLLQNNTSLLIENNGRDGLGVTNVSNFYTDDTSTVTIRGSARYGMAVNRNSCVQLGGGTVLIENNPSYGVSVNQMSVLYVYGGAVTIRNNKNNGLFVDNSEVRVEANSPSPNPNILTVSGTTTSQGTGIYLMNNAVLRINGASLAVQNNVGSNGYGIHINLGSLAMLIPTGTNTVSITDNAYGIVAWNDGSLNTNNNSPSPPSVTIKGNSTKDVALYLASRAYLAATAYETVFCDGTALTAGGITCP